MGERKTSDQPSGSPPKGFLAGTARCGLKKAGDDLAIIFSERPAVAAAVFTQNLVQAAPVLVSREHLRFKSHRAIVVNSGGANACTGPYTSSTVNPSNNTTATRLVGKASMVVSINNAVDATSGEAAWVQPAVYENIRRV